MKGKNDVQSAPAVVGTVQETEAQIRFVKAYWAWIRRKRDKTKRNEPFVQATCPRGQDYGLSVEQVQKLIELIMKTKSFRLQKLYEKPPQYLCK